MTVACKQQVRYGALCLVLSLLLVTGCGVHLNQQAAVQPLSQPPPAQPPPIAGQNGAITIQPQYAATGPGKALQFSPSVQNGAAVNWLVNGVQGGNATVGTIDTNGNYSAPVVLPQSINVTVTAALAASPATDFATAIVSLIHPGAVTATTNPQVATYSIYLPAPGQVHIEFGPTASYGLPTWEQPTPSPNGGQVGIYVAGMRAQLLYHMRALVTLADGATYTDTDQIFTTGAAPVTAAVTASAQNNQTPQPGIELFDTLLPREPAPAFATDLTGNVIWTYSYGGTAEDALQPLKLLPNGHFLAQIAYLSSITLRNPTILPGTLDEVREVDLVGNTIRSLTQTQLAAALTAQGYAFTLGSLHHDVLALPNGHMVLLATTTKTFSNLPGYPGTTNVIGDVLIDVDQNFNPDWVWNSFDHLDVNRHPFQFPDWTHSNSLLYSADDGNLLLSVRHQNWILKIDFNDGKGSGNILWRLGEGGDFKLTGGTDPTDWFYAQHDPSYFSPNTTGLFKLGVMDNGDDRPLPPGTVCSGPALSCLYSTVPVFAVDENARTATLIEHYKPSPSLYSYFGGNVDLLGNGNLEADFCGVATGAVVQELNLTGSSPQLVWQAVTGGASQYRAERLPSLYPGVQW